MTRGMGCVDDVHFRHAVAGAATSCESADRHIERLGAYLGEANDRLERLTAIADAILALPVREAGIVVPVSLRLQLQREFTEEPI